MTAICQPMKCYSCADFEDFIDQAINGYVIHTDQEQIKIEPSVHAPLVYKLHGSLDDLDSMIITEDNYIDFLINLIEGNPKIPDKIKNIFDTCCILFVGYGLKDWNIRVLLRYFRKYDRRSFAIQRDQAATSDEGRPSGNRRRHRRDVEVRTNFKLPQGVPGPCNPGSI